MALYSYKAADAAGRVHKGLLDANSQAELEFHLERNALYLIHARVRRKHPVSRKICRRNLITFFFNMDHLLRSGVPLLECLNDLHNSMDEPQFRAIISALTRSIESGATLSQAMAQHPQAFNGILVSLTHAAEASGRLPEVFGHITESLKWQDELAVQTRNMMIYPVFAGTLMGAAIIFMMLYLVPQLAGFLRGMGQEVPLQTRLLLGISDMIGSCWYFLLAFAVLLFLASCLALKYQPSLQYHLDRFKLSVWPTGPILRKIILARFANTFAMMYASGISVLECLSRSRDLAGNLVIARNLERAAQEVESGRNLTQSFRDTGIFPPLVLRMLKVGETSGQLDIALRNVSYFYERDVKESVKGIQALLEPLMTIALGTLLGWVMLSVLSPIYGILGKVQI